MSGGSIGKAIKGVSKIAANPTRILKGIAGRGNPLKSGNENSLQDQAQDEADKKQKLVNAALARRKNKSLLGSANTEDLGGMSLKNKLGD